MRSSIGDAAPRLAALALCAALAGCATVEPGVYSDLTSSSQLRSNPRDDTGRVPYSYETAVAWRTYTKVIIHPVKVYRGPDHQFGDLTEADKASLASYMQAEFTKKLLRQFALSNQSGPNTLLVKLTLTGATTSTPVLSTLSRFDIAGGIYNGVQAMRSREGALTGSVMYAVEIHDAMSGQLLKAYITKQYPSVYNLAATMGSLSAARAGIENGADELVAYVR